MYEQFSLMDLGAEEIAPAIQDTTQPPASEEDAPQVEYPATEDAAEAEQPAAEAAPAPHYYEINERTARAAHDMMSMRDYKPNSATSEYRAQVDAAAAVLEEVKAKCKTEMQREKAEYHFDRYCKVLAYAINRDNQIGTRCPSILISGGSNFPVRKKEKQVAAWESNRENFSKAEYHFDMMKQAHTQTVNSNDPEVIEYLKSKLEKLEALQADMKAANAYYRKHKTLDGCPGITQKDLDWLTRPGVFASGDGSPLTLYKRPFPTYALSNNNANIKRVKERLQNLEAVKAAAPVETTTDLYTYKENSEAMRVQFFFEDKPDDETRAILKSHGFRWAPSQNAWQRQLTRAGQSAARAVMDALNKN